MKKIAIVIPAYNEDKNLISDNFELILMKFRNSKYIFSKNIIFGENTRK